MSEKNPQFLLKLANRLIDGAGDKVSYTNDRKAFCLLEKAAMSLLYQFSHPLLLEFPILVRLLSLNTARWDLHLFSLKKEGAGIDDRRNRQETA